MPLAAALTSGIRNDKEIDPMMARFVKWAPFGFLAAGFVLLGTPRDAHALLVLTGTIQSAGTTYTVYVADNNSAYPGGPPASVGGGPVIALVDTNNAVGNITLNPGTLFPGYTVNSSTSFDSKGFNANALTSNALEIVNNTGGTVTTNIGVGDNGFVGPANTVVGSASGTWTNAGGSVYNTFFYNDPANAQPLQGPGGVSNIPGNLVLQDSHTVIGTSDSYGSGPLTASVNDPGLFSMTLRFNFTLVAGGTFVSRGQNELKTSALPEPATFAMALGGLPVLGVYWLRRRRQES